MGGSKDIGFLIIFFKVAFTSGRHFLIFLQLYYRVDTKLSIDRMHLFSTVSVFPNFTVRLLYG